MCVSEVIIVSSYVELHGIPNKSIIRIKDLIGRFFIQEDGTMFFKPLYNGATFRLVDSGGEPELV